VVDVLGTITTVDSAEKAIAATAITRRSQAAIPAALGTPNKNLVLGAPTVGLYMKLWGRVDSVNASTGTFTITDGSGNSLKVYGTATAGDYVQVIGAIGAEKPATSVVPVVRAVSATKVNE
jgi:hypothetical protein